MLLEVFRVKYDGNGEVKCFKGRLVAQGFSQRYGVDYEEIFSPVVHLSSIRTLLAFAAEKKLQVHQMDVVSAFLNGELAEEIYRIAQNGGEGKLWRIWRIWSNSPKFYPAKFASKFFDILDYRRKKDRANTCATVTCLF